MEKEILNTAILALVFLTLFVLAEVLYRKFNTKAEYTRKLVHVGTGIITLLFPAMLNNHWLVLFLCASFAVILLVSLQYNFLPSINAIDRKSYGSLCYPLAAYTSYLVYDYLGNQYFYFYIPMLVLAICDPIAALTGKKWPLGKFHIGNETKSIMGSVCFCVTAVIISYMLLSFTNNTFTTVQNLTMSIVLGVVSAITEAISKKGIDNVTIPAAVILTLYGMINAIH